MKTLTDLQAENLPHAEWREFLEATGLTADEERIFDEYFSRFLPPGACAMCGAKQGGDVMDLFLGAAKFTWGLTHGEGYCANKGCHYPARAYHYNVGPIKRLELILQYHPSELRPASAATEELEKAEA